ncbi:PepSY domain-containing protein [Ramlibacter sp.]|uniref:PepSY domain-containing protein n=1 Tax=Ramlibacter sp. TaxID=1917967 RepID=UPI003D11B628
MKPHRLPSGVPTSGPRRVPPARGGRAALRALLAALMAGGALAAAGPAFADVSRDDAAAVVKRETGGRVLAVERAEVQGRAVWRVKVVTPGGDVRVLLVDVASGKSL